MIEEKLGGFFWPMLFTNWIKAAHCHHIVMERQLMDLG